MQNHHIALHRLDMRFGFLYRANEQTTILVESHPLWQEEFPGGWDKWSLQLAAVICSAFLGNSIAGLGDGRLGGIVFHWNRGNLFVVTGAVGYRATCGQKVVNHVDRSGITQQSGADGHPSFADFSNSFSRCIN